MANRQAYPNTLITYTVQIFVGGVSVTGVLSAATLVIDSGSPIAMSVSGMDLLATIPNTQSPGLNTPFALQWDQTVDGVTTTQTVTYLVDILPAPSGSSQSYVPTNIGRQCQRLAEPADTTVEQTNGGNLTIYANVPYSLLRSVASNLPSSGPDVVSLNYVDTQGQPGTLAFNCTLWMSDNAYILISADNGWQYAISSVNGNFFDANAQAINTRNTNNGAPALLPCLNASRYDWPSLLVNQNLPSLFIYDGILLGGGSSSSSG